MVALKERKYLWVVSILLFSLALLFPLCGFAGNYNGLEFKLNDSTKEITITGYTGTDAEITIPASIYGYDVTAIGNRSFEYSQVQSIRFEKGSKLEVIENIAFAYCEKLLSIYLPDTVRFIGSSAFLNCEKLSNIKIPEGVINIDFDTFSGCTSLDSVVLPSTLQSISFQAFENCSSLRSISIPKGVTEIGFNAFRGSGLTQIKIPSGVTCIDSACFMDCTSLKNVILSDNVSEIWEEAFKNCSSLVSINIPNDLNMLDYEAFENCISLKKLRFGESASPAAASYNIFKNCPRLNIDVVRGSAMETYCINNNIPITVYATSIGGCTIDGIKDVTYNGKPQKLKLKISVFGKTLKSDRDYTVNYDNNTNAGSASLTVKGIGNYLGSVSKSFNILPADINACKIKLAKTSVRYSAQSLEPSVKVTYKGKAVSTSDYKLIYTSNVYVGQAMVTVSGQRNFINSKTLNFKIIPNGSAIRKLTQKDGKVTITWKQNTIQTTGYQIQYALNENFTGAKKKVITSSYTVSAEINKLTSGKKYYFRIRTYKNVNGTMFYSDWSSAKSIKLK